MKCLIITNESGVSLQFDDFVAKGSVLLHYEDSGLSLNYPFSNTNFVLLPAGYFNNRGNVEVKVLSNNITLAKKRITNNRLKTIVQ